MLLEYNDEFFRQLENASAISGEQVWRLPDFPEYSEMLKSKIADLQNIGKNKMAGTAWRDADESYNSAGGTGAGVRLLYHLMK